VLRKAVREVDEMGRYAYWPDLDSSRLGIARNLARRGYLSQGWIYNFFPTDKGRAAIGAQEAHDER